MNVKGLLGARLVAILIVAVVSGSSFMLGFYVGKTTTGDIGTPAPLIEDTEKTVQAESRTELPEDSRAGMPISVEEEATGSSSHAAPPEPAAPLVSKPQAGKKTPEKSVVKPSPDSIFSVQAGAFKKKTDAESLKRRLSAKGYSAYLLDGDGGISGGVFKVRIGRFPDRKEAEAIALKLKNSEGIPAFVAN
ncbi:MAG: SPOR domain-containing protein [Thermodesulfovibrionales bacterium]|nr:SPOR domain-containing protein [Thermodesulfovibrionales bacterium]